MNIEDIKVGQKYRVVDDGMLMTFGRWHCFSKDDIVIVEAIASPKQIICVKDLEVEQILLPKNLKPLKEKKPWYLRILS